jgi:hypothetical protein
MESAGLIVIGVIFGIIYILSGLIALIYFFRLCSDINELKEFILDKKENKDEK